METWTQLWADPVAGLKGLASTMCLADLKNEADWSFIIGDTKKKLRVYKEKSISWESTLIDIPSSVTIYYPELNSAPNLAIASGNSIFIYKNSRPFFKFTLPPIDLSSNELKIWQDLKENLIEISKACELLNALRDSEVYISSRSTDLLSYDKDSDRISYLESVMELPVLQLPCITCMGVLSKDMDIETGCSMLVVGTENKFIYILDQVGSSILRKIQIPATPVIINTLGLYNSESRVIVACRESKVISIKNGAIISDFIELETPPSGLVVIDKYIFVGSYDNKVHCFHLKGRKLYSLYMPNAISCMNLLKLSRTRVFKGLLIGLSNGEIRLYKDKVLLNTINVGDSIQGLCFGTYGKDEGVLVVNLKNGGIVMKKINKSANFEGRSEFMGPPPEQEVPLAIPTKSKLYLEQVDRERENSINMYRGFLKDLVAIKLRTVKNFVRTENIESSNKVGGVNLRMNAYVQGLGPIFSIVLELENCGNDICVDVRLGYSYDPALFKVISQTAYFPVLVPGLKYKQNISLQSLQGASENIRVFLISTKSVFPVISAFINVPSCEEIN